jgi:hypothetical protein
MNSPVNNTPMDVVAPASPVVATKVIKSLPVKHKCVMLGMLGLVEHLKKHMVLPEEHLQTTFETFKQMIFMTPDEQVTFLDQFVDIQYLEKTLVKELIQQNKKDAKAAEKEKVKAEKKAEREKNKVPKAPSAPKPTDSVQESSDDTPVQKETAAQKKERLKLEKQKEKEEKAAEKLREKEEKAAEKLREKEAKKAENKKDKKDKKDKKVTTPSSVPEPEPEQEPEVANSESPMELDTSVLSVQNPDELSDELNENCTMFIIDGMKYWNNDGIIMTNVNNSEGDSTPGKPVGEFIDGVPHFTIKPPHQCTNTPVLTPVEKTVEEPLVEVPVEVPVEKTVEEPLVEAIVEKKPREKKLKKVADSKTGTKPPRILKKTPKLKQLGGDTENDKSSSTTKRGRQAISLTTVLDKVPEMPSDHSPQTLCNSQQTSTSVDELSELLQETYLDSSSSSSSSKLAVNK